MVLTPASFFLILVRSVCVVEKDSRTFSGCAKERVDNFVFPFLAERLYIYGVVEVVVCIIETWAISQTRVNVDLS